MKPRMKQFRQLIGQGIKAGNVRSLVEVAIDAGESKIVESIRAPVFQRPDVLNVESREWRVGLSEPTVFATIAGPSANEDASGDIDGHLLVASRFLAFA